MTDESPWKANRAIDACTHGPWAGTVWRIHDRKYSPVDPAGSLKVSGRFNRGLDRFPVEQTWSVLYLAIERDVALGELIRHLSPDLLSRLKSKRLTELHLDLAQVVDCRDLVRLDLPPDGLFDDRDFRIPQEPAKAALDKGFEAMFVPSATLLGDNLIVFDRNLQKSSRIEVVTSIDPRLLAE